MITCSPSLRPSTIAAVSGVNWPRRHAALPGDILIVDHVHVATLLIGEGRGTRHGDDLLRLHGFKKYSDELIGDELAKLDTSRRRRTLEPDSE